MKISSLEYSNFERVKSKIRISKWVELEYVNDWNLSNIKFRFFNEIYVD